MRRRKTILMTSLAVALVLVVGWYLQGAMTAIDLTLAEGAPEPAPSLPGRISGWLEDVLG
ncbi:MAG: hypothetical protein AAGI70_07165 [Pseudomonadota bacterium]